MDAQNKLVVVGDMVNAQHANELKQLNANMLSSMKAAFEWGFRTGEAGQWNLQAALAHFDKTMQS